MTIIELFGMFPNNEVAEKWFEEQRWPDGAVCPDCGSRNCVETSHKTMRYRCKDCRQFFSVRKGSVMEGSKIGFQKWAIAIYMVTTSLKGISSMKLHRELGVTQKTAWFMLGRIREAFEEGDLVLQGDVEVDETHIGGKEKNKHESKKLKRGRGATGKVAVIGAKERETGKIKAMPIESTGRDSLHGFIGDNVEGGLTVYTDDHKGYLGLKDYFHKTVKHSVGEYVNGMAHTNGIESFWALFKRGFHGTYHQLSKKHLHRYVTEFTGRNNIRSMNTDKQWCHVAAGMVGKRLLYKDLVA